MMPNSLLSPVLTVRVNPVPGTCFGLKMCGACCELLSCAPEQYFVQEHYDAVRF